MISANAIAILLVKMRFDISSLPNFIRAKRIFFWCSSQSDVHRTNMKGASSNSARAPDRATWHSR
jgi:hypothetical protein